jgi:hypothetical protein
MRLPVKTTLVAAACSFLGAAASAQRVKITPQLKTGDEFSIDVTAMREDSSRPGPTAKGITPIDVRVVSVTPNGVALDWTLGETRIESSQAVDPIVLAAANALRGLRLRINLDADGSYAALANESEVISRVQPVVDQFSAAVMEKLPADQRATMKKMLAQLLTPALLVEGATREAQTYFSLSGVDLPVGDSAVIDLTLPSPFGGSALPAKFRVTMESATSDSAVLTTTTTYAADGLRRMTLALFEQTGKPIPESELAKLPVLQMSDEGRFVFDRKLGLPRELVVNRRISGGKVQRLDRREIRLVRAPQR